MCQHQVRFSHCTPLTGGHVENVTLIFCHRHAGVQGIELTHSLAGNVAIEDITVFDPPTIMSIVHDHLAVNRLGDVKSGIQTGQIGPKFDKSGTF